MAEQALTPSVLKALRERHPYPVLSLTMPAHRRPENAQDPVRLRNLVAEAERRLDADPEVGRDARLALKEQLQRALADADFELLGAGAKGVLLFVDQSSYQFWYLPRWVPEQVVFSDTFLTQNLVAARAVARPYWVVVADADRATLWRGTSDQVFEHHEAGFPHLRDQIQFDPQRTEQQGDAPSLYQQEETVALLRATDGALAKVLEAEPLPFYLVGVPAAVHKLEELGKGGARTPSACLTKGGLNGLPAHVLAEELAPARAEHAKQVESAALARLDQAVSRKSAAFGVDEVWQTVHEGRVNVLLVEEEYHVTGKVTGEHLEVLTGDAAAQRAVTDDTVREDVVDEIIEAALDRGAEVVFLPDGALTDHGRIAAALRY